MVTHIEKKAISYDVRAVRLIKSVHGGPVCLTGNADFISLGHFDLLHVDHLRVPPASESDQDEGILKFQSSKKNPLALIQSDRRSGREIELVDGIDSVNQVYTLYILRQLEEDNLPSVRLFWDREDTYMVVTRIHCQYPKGRQKRRLTQILIDHCRCSQPNPYRVKFRSQDGEVMVMSSAVDSNKEGDLEPVYCLFYDSLELGDCVSVMKSKSVAAIMEVVQYLSGESTVRDTYTYCGIRRSLLLSNDESVLANAVHPKAKLSHMTTRFSIRNASAANDYISCLTNGDENRADNAYITGTADQILCWHDTSEANLIRIAKAMVQKEEWAHDCFNDVITRIGIKPIKEDMPSGELQEVKGCSSSAENNTKESLCSVALKKYLHSRHKEADAPSWIYSLLKLIGTLESMQDNYIMDDLAAFITPGVKALLARMEYLLKNAPSGKLTPNFDRDILGFLHDWSDLMHDLSQLESQLTQHPELMPVRYYIPVTLLQFELRFMEHCGKMLQEKATDCRRFVPMLVPSGERDLYTVAPLDPGQDSQDSYSGESPLIVYIPIQDLYDPWNCSLRMAHEIAHYVGNMTRKRHLRTDALCKCLSHFIARRWDHYFRIYAPLEGKESQQKLAIQDLTKRIQQCVDTFLSEKEAYLDLTARALADAAHQIASNIKNQDLYLATVDPEYFQRYVGSYANQKYANIQQSFRPALTRSCEKHIKALRHFSSECYADIAMILLLDCSFDSYYNCIYWDEFDRLKKLLKQSAIEPPFDPRVVQHIQRMALVIAAVETLRIDCKDYNKSHWVSFEALENDARIWASWAGGMARVAIAQKLSAAGIQNDLYADQHIKDFLLDWQIESSTVLSMAEMQVLAEYLAECATELYKNLHLSSADSSQIKEGLECLYGSDSANQNSFSWDKLQQYVLGASSAD